MSEGDFSTFVSPSSPEGLLCGWHASFLHKLEILFKLHLQEFCNWKACLSHRSSLRGQVFKSERKILIGTHLSTQTDNIKWQTLQQSKGDRSQVTLWETRITDNLIIVLWLPVFILKMDFGTIEINTSASNVHSSSTQLTPNLVSQKTDRVNEEFI